MRTWATELACVGAVLLAGCSGDNGERAGENAGGPLAGLDGDTLCEMVDRGTVEKQFNEPVSDTLGGVNPPEQRSSIVCLYVFESFVEADTEDLAEEPMVTVKVTDGSDRGSTAEDVLDAYMVDLGGETIAYGRVDGLGAAAGFAGPELEVLTGGSHLVTILEVDGAFIEVVAKSEPVGTVDQLRPIADELTKGVEQKLR